MDIKSSIKNKLVSYFGIILGVSFLVIAIAANKLCQSIMESDTVKYLEKAVSSTSNQVNMILEQKKQDLEQIAQLQEINSSKSTIEEKLTVLKYLSNIAAFEEIAFVDLEGNKYSTNASKENISDSQAFKVVSDIKQAFIEVVQVEEEPMLSICIPVVQEEELIGMLIGLDFMQDFDSVLNNIECADEYVLLDVNGTIIAHSARETSNILVHMEQIANQEEYNEAYDLFKTMSEGKQGTRLCKGIKTKGKNYVGYAPTGMGWSLALVSDRSDIMFSTFIHFNIKLIGIMMILIVVAIVIVHSIAKSFANQMSELVSCMEDMASGDLEKPVPKSLIEQKDEIGDLARAIRTMKLEIQEMLSTIKHCTDYMNEQMEDLTVEIKDAIKNALVLENRKLDERYQEDIIQHLKMLNRISEILPDFHIVKRDKI